MADVYDTINNRLFADPILLGRYPDGFAELMPGIVDVDLAIIGEPVDWHEKAWHLDEFVGGGYMALPKAGATDGGYPMAATPIGRLHWAGTETAVDHPGYLDGAIEAGLRAAAEVDAQLRAAQ